MCTISCICGNHFKAGSERGKDGQKRKEEEKPKQKKMKDEDILALTLTHIPNYNTFDGLCFV